MKYKINTYLNLKIKNFMKTQKFFFFTFFITKKQKLNIKTQQSFYNKSFQISKFNNIYLKKIIKHSIFSNLNCICSGFIYLGNVQNKKVTFLELKKINIYSIIFENSIYNSKQFTNVLNFNYNSTLSQLYFFLNNFFFKLFTILFKNNVSK